MGAQVLGPVKTRRIARATGLDITRAWSHGGYVMGFVTPDHRHGWYDLKTGDHGFDDPAEVIHYTSCAENFG